MEILKFCVLLKANSKTVELGNVFQNLDKTWKSFCDTGSQSRYILIIYKNDRPSYITPWQFFLFFYSACNVFCSPGLLNIQRWGLQHTSAWDCWEHLDITRENTFDLFLTKMRLILLWMLFLEFLTLFALLEIYVKRFFSPVVLSQSHYPFP